MDGKGTNKRGQCQIYLGIAEREYLRRSQSPNKRGENEFARILSDEVPSARS